MPYSSTSWTASMTNSLVVSESNPPFYNLPRFKSNTGWNKSNPVVGFPGTCKFLPICCTNCHRLIWGYRSFVCSRGSASVAKIASTVCILTLLCVQHRRHLSVDRWTACERVHVMTACALLQWPWVSLFFASVKAPIFAEDLLASR